MATNPIPALIKEQYYTKVFAGKGDLTDDIPDAQIGYFYLDASSGAIYAYDGTAWTDVSSTISIAL